MSTPLPTRPAYADVSTLLDGPVTVSVPASSANLGPGFDSLGLALDLRDLVTARVTEHGARIVVTGAGENEVPLDENHLVYKAAVHTLEALGCDLPGLSLNCENRIPHGRGLGSSSAAIVAGICAARALLADGRQRMDDDQVFQLAARLEGHPDNVAPAMFGGCTIAVPKESGFLVARTAVDPRVRAVVFVAPDPVATTLARSLLPERVAHRAAASNAGRAALLVAALGGHPELLVSATEDQLHQEFRRPAMPDTLRLVHALRAEGVAAVVSGAGPSVLALLEDRGSSLDESNRADLLARAPSGWAVMELPVSHLGAVVSAGSVTGEGPD